MSALGPLAGPPPDNLPLGPDQGGGPGPGGPGPGGPGPDPGALAALLGPPGAGPGGPGVGVGGGDEESEEEIIYKQIADDLHHAMHVEKDPQDQAIIAKMLTLIAQLRAGRDKEKQDALGMSPQLKLAMRQNR